MRYKHVLVRLDIRATDATVRTLAELDADGFEVVAAVPNPQDHSSVLLISKRPDPVPLGGSEAPPK